MVGASKILTVSYGTFSCTLEGFDDPFNTMRAIAEYFRDLAAEDRFFGATPPTPDADMLHRIAERENQRRVEARVSDHGIVLRARDEAVAAPAAPLAEVARAPVAEPAPVAPSVSTSAAALATAAAEPAAAPESDYDDLTEETMDAAEAEVFARVTAPAAETTAPLTVEPAAEAAIDDMGDVAAKLSRIRAVIAAAQAAKAAPVPAADETVFEDAQDMAPTAFEEEAVAEAEFDSAATVDDDFGFELELDDFPVSRPAAPVVPEAAAEPEFDADTADEAVAETEAEDEEEPVTGASEPGEPAEWEVEPEVAERAAEVEAAAVPEEIEDLTGEETAAEAEPAEALLSDEDFDDDDYAALAVATLMGADGGIAADAATAPEAAGDVVAEDDARLDALDLAGWRVEADEEDESAEDEAEAEFEGDEDDEDFVADAAEEPAARPQAAGPAELRPGFFERARARVINIRRGAEPEAATVEAVDDPAAEASAPVTAGTEAHAAAEVAADEDPLILATPEAPAEDTDAAEEVEHAAIFAALTEDEDGEERFEEDLAEAPEEAAAVETDDAADAEPEEDHAAILAEIGAAIAASHDETEDDEALSRDLAAMARDARRDSHEGRTILEDHAGDGDASVERLMEEAKSKLEGDESRRRFSAIAHLKAAVAATVADRKLKPQAMPTDQAAPEEDIDRYRDDLSKAVRPRRPVAEGTPATRRPALSDRPAPLVLVSEQRVDVPADEVRHAAAVRPRRIGAAALSISEVEEDFDDEAPLSPEEARSFAEFADRLGATDLAELLEAAAAYTATVEGLPHFSRPHLLKKIANFAEEEEFSREDGLRSFGMLLRQGKIQKISRGQFTITESSRFMEQARRVAH